MPIQEGNVSQSIADLEVRDLMTRKAVSVRAYDSLSLAAQLMWDNDCGVLPVLDNEGRRVLGVVTDRDICMAAWSRNVPLSELAANEAMSRDLVACSADDTIQTAENTMRTRQVRRLPVLDSASNLIGILSVTDIARAASQKSFARAGYEISPKQVIDTLSRISDGPLKSNHDGANVREW